MIFMALGNMKRVFFFFLQIFLHSVRHPVVSGGRPTAVDQVLVRVSMIP